MLHFKQERINKLFQLILEKKLDKNQTPYPRRKKIRPIPCNSKTHTSPRGNNGLKRPRKSLCAAAAPHSPSVNCPSHHQKRAFIFTIAAGSFLSVLITTTTHRFFLLPWAKTTGHFSPAGLETHSHLTCWVFHHFLLLFRISFTEWGLTLVWN